MEGGRGGGSGLQTLRAENGELFQSHSPSVHTRSVRWPEISGPSENVDLSSNFVLTHLGEPNNSVVSCRSLCDQERLNKSLDERAVTAACDTGTYTMYSLTQCTK